jgi:uncharacterized protein YbjQ (UPF0145 family)
MMIYGYVNDRGHYPFLVLLTMGIAKLFWWLGDGVEEKYRKKLLNKKITEVDKIADKLEKLMMTNINSMDNRKYETMDMIEASGVDKEKTKQMLRYEAYKLGANGIIGVALTTQSNTEGAMHDKTMIIPSTSGTIRTSTIYHYSGTPIKFV